jgi:tRNA dimethylallyltransferase
VDAKPFESLGYRQALDVVQERLTLEQALASTQAATRRYAKRQLTWFRKEHSVHWLQGFGDDEQVQDQALAVIQQTVERG